MVIYSIHIYILSANHPYLQPEGSIANGAAQRDRLNACDFLLCNGQRLAEGQISFDGCRFFFAVLGVNSYIFTEHCGTRNQEIPSF